MREIGIVYKFQLNNELKPHYSQDTYMDNWYYQYPEGWRNPFKNVWRSDFVEHQSGIIRSIRKLIELKKYETY